MVAEKSPYIQSAYNQLKLISQDKEKRMEYEARQKAILDYNQGMLEAREEGRNQERAIWEQREQQWEQQWNRREQQWKQREEELIAQLEALKKDKL